MTAFSETSALRAMNQSCVLSALNYLYSCNLVQVGVWTAADSSSFQHLMILGDDSWMFLFQENVAVQKSTFRVTSTVHPFRKKNSKKSIHFFIPT